MENQQSEFTQVFELVCQKLPVAGFSNVAEHENVIFFNHPGDPLRVDFLQIDSETMETLIAGAVNSTYGGHALLIPALKDLIAMKLFSMKTGSPAREEKDFPDIVHLVLEQGLDIENDLKPLCLQYGDEIIYKKLKTRILELGNA